MSSCTDLLCLNEKQLFKDIREKLPSGVKETRNILEIHDNVLYVWNVNKCCVLALNLAGTRDELGEDASYQSLRPTDPPILEVTNVLINETVTQLALWGNLGISLMELPKRWSKDTVFEGGEEILCINHNFGDFAATTEIKRVRWHPASTNDSHLLVLTSENSFRLYECELGGAPRLVKCWKVGRAPSSSPAKIPDFASLGEIAVDFDFVTPTLKRTDSFIDKNIDEIRNSVDWNQIEWPILILRGNGEVLIIRGNVLLENYVNPVVLGSLSMYPSSDDNYGIDSCSIMCLQTTPPIVVIAMCPGKIYHAILLRETLNDDDDDRKYDSSYNLRAAEDALYVFECIELELGLLFTDDDKKYNCLIHLHSDNGNKSRYFCFHNAGIHMVNLPMVSQLQEFINAPNDKCENHLPSLSNKSTLQYLFSMRTKHTSVDEATPIFGFGLLQEPCIFVALLHTGVVVDLSVIDLYYLPIAKQLEPIVNTTRKVIKKPFDAYIKQLLRRDVSQPITKIGSHSISLSESLELLYHATNIFRTQHFVRHDKVREEINKKVYALKILKIYLLKELDTLIKTKKKLQHTAKYLEERFTYINTNQETLTNRAKEVLRLVNNRKPFPTTAERAEAEELKKMNMKMHNMQIRLEQLKKKSAQQILHTDSVVSNEKKEIVFTRNQEEAIKENLSQITKNIENLVTQVKQMQEEVMFSYINKQ